MNILAQTTLKPDSMGRSINQRLNSARFIGHSRIKRGIPISNIKPLVKLLVSEGVPIEALLKDTQITLTELTQVDNHLALDCLLKLITNARNLCKTPEYALILGEQFFINHDGVLACRVMSSDHTQAAMEILTQYQNLFTQLLELNLDITDDYGIFSIEEKIPLGDALPHFVEYTFSALFSLGKFCLGKHEMPLEFEFSHSTSNNRNLDQKNRFESFFRNPVSFNSSANRIIIPKETLIQPIIFSDKRSAQQNESLCQQHLKRTRTDQQIIQKVKQSMRSMAFTEVSMSALSNQLCMSTRSLRRHLQTQGVSYKTLLESERKRIALKRVEKQDVSIELLASELGYQSAASFSRAFKRWFGIAPHHYKKRSTEIHK